MKKEASKLIITDDFVSSLSALFVRFWLAREGFSSKRVQRQLYEQANK